MRITCVVLACLLAAACGQKNFVDGGKLGKAPHSCTATLEIESGALGNPNDVVSCRKGDFLTILVVDRDRADYAVSVDPGAITRNGHADNPLNESTPGSSKATAALPGVIVFHVRGNAEYGKYTYKLIITLSTGQAVAFDPDIEIAN